MFISNRVTSLRFYLDDKTVGLASGGCCRGAAWPRSKPNFQAWQKSSVSVLDAWDIFIVQMRSSVSLFFFFCSFLIPPSLRPPRPPLLLFVLIPILSPEGNILQHEVYASRQLENVTRVLLLNGMSQPNRLTCTLP